MNPARTPIAAGNWKMNLNAGPAVELARATAGHAGRHPGVETAIAPPFTALAAVREALRGSPVALAGQNMHFAPRGAFTGEIAPAMLVDAGCSLVLLGHSERRHVFGEVDDLIGRKVRAAIDHDLLPVLCVGEKLEEREAGTTLEVVRRQLEAGLAPLAPAEVSRTVVAYEPVWAIGTGRVASPEDAQEVHGAIRRFIGEIAAGSDAAVRILYGGSVTGDNAAGLLAMPDIDGVLVGGASLKADDFGRIIAAAAAPRR
jgi:triosephosphate isomerase